MASRRNADFLAFTSTIVNDAAGADNFKGMAGEPPPDPMSIRLATDAGR